MKSYCHEQHFKPFARELNSINQYTSKIERYDQCHFNPFQLRYKGKDIVTWYDISDKQIDIEINEGYIMTVSIDEFYNHLKKIYTTEKVDIENYWKKSFKEIISDMQQLVNNKIK